MSFIKELKRRNVIRVATVYAVGAWLMIQIVDTTFPILSLPDWTVTLVTVLILIGFPLALILAWAYELTPEGIKLAKDVDRSESITHITGRKLDFIVIGVLAVALILFAVDRFVLLPDTAPAYASAQRIVATKYQQSIAVLPFVNMSDDPGNEYFSDGLSEEILNLLARIPSLKVIARTSSFSFKGKNEDVRNIGEALGVKTVLEGSVRKSGDRVRITAQLIDVSDGAHLWSDSYDRTVTDIFAVQDEVAAAIIDALQIHVGRNPTRGRPTESPEAYSLFLKAKVSLDAQRGEDAIEPLRQATEIDPIFAEAFELLAFAYWQQGGSSIPAAQSQTLCNEAAARALAIDPDLTFSRAMYALTRFENSSAVNATILLEQAWREQPNDSARLRALIYDLTYRGYFREAHQLALQFVELDPLSPIAHYSLGESFVALGSKSEAVAALELSLELENAFAEWFVPVFDLAEGRDDKAIAYYEADLERIGISDTGWVRELITGTRDPLNGQAYLDSRVPEILASLSEEAASEWQYTFDLWYLVFGFIDHFYMVLFAAGPDDVVWSRADFVMWEGTIFGRAGFTANPRYLEAAELLGIIDYWEQRGPPDFCKKTDDQWVCE